MNALGKTTPRDVRKQNTWRLIDIKSGETIACWGSLPSWEGIVTELQIDRIITHWTDDVHCAQIETEGHPLENAEYITVNGKPAAFVSWDAHPIDADEMREVFFPKSYQIAAE